MTTFPVMGEVSAKLTPKRQAAKIEAHKKTFARALLPRPLTAVGPLVQAAVAAVRGLAARSCNSGCSVRSNIPSLEGHQRVLRAIGKFRQGAARGRIVRAH